MASGSNHLQRRKERLLGLETKVGELFLFDFYSRCHQLFGHLLVEAGRVQIGQVINRVVSQGLLEVRIEIKIRQKVAILEEQHLNLMLVDPSL